MPSSDANPYLAIAASLACGYLGMIEELTPSEPIDGSANDAASSACRAACSRRWRCSRNARNCARSSASASSSTYRAIKQAEFETFMRVISPWEREYLLLNV